MNVFSKLGQDIITFQILPHLDGKTLIILSSVSSQFHNLICKNNNSDLWLNICTSTWPSLLTTFPIQDLLSIISILPGGYRSFFCNAFPSIHPPPLNNPPPPPPPLPPKVFCFYAADIFLHGEEGEKKPLYSIYAPQNPPLIYPPIFRVELHHGMGNFNFIKVKKEGCLEYLKQKLTLSCVAINPKGIMHAGSLFTYGCEAVSATRVPIGVMLLFETVLPVPEELSISYTEMIKCRIRVICNWEGRGEDKFCVSFVYFTMEDMNEKPLLVTHGAAVILNAIQNGERRARTT